jgi:hypothetical protein
MALITRPLKTHSFNDYMDKYALFKPNHTYYRSWTIDKFMGGFAVSYIFLRELPVRNFYARVFLMYIFAAKILDHMKTIWPFGGPCGDIIAASDNWQHWDVRCYDYAWRMINFIAIPTAANDVRESTKWYGK